MDDREEALSLILHGCNLARQFELNLPQLVENHTRCLIPPCDNIVRAFNQAMVLLGSSPPPPGGMFLGGSSEQRQELGVAGAQDLFSGDHTQPMDLIHALGAGVYPTSEMGMRDVGELGLEAPAGSTRGALELELGGLDMAAYVRSGDEESFQGLRASGDHVQPMLEMEESDSIIRSPTVLRGPSFQRLRTRREGQETYRTTVQAPSPRTANPETAPEDGHTWRKYGQKVILNSRYPRSYYRCAHRATHGCDAKKQVQRLDEQPYIFQVTYHGFHTCKTSETHVVGESSRAQSLPSISRTSTQLGSWEEFEVDQREGNVPAETQVQEVGEGRGGASAGEPSHVREVNEMEGVVNIADFMFNSGSSDNSIDSIFSPKPNEDQN